MTPVRIGERRRWDNDILEVAGANGQGLTVWHYRAIGGTPRKRYRINRAWYQELPNLEDETVAVCLRLRECLGEMDGFGPRKP